MAGIEAIATTYVEDPVGSVTFSSIPQTYEHLQIRVSARSDNNGGGGHQVYVRFNGVQTTHYSSSRFYSYTWEGSYSHSADRYAGQSYVYAGGRIPEGNMDNVDFGMTIMEIIDYTNPYKRSGLVQYSGVVPGYNNGAGDSGSHVQFGGAFLDFNTAVTSVQLYPPSDNWSRGTCMSLYGMND